MDRRAFLGAIPASVLITDNLRAEPPILAQTHITGMVTLEIKHERAWGKPSVLLLFKVMDGSVRPPREIQAMRYRLTDDQIADIAKALEEK